MRSTYLFQCTLLMSAMLLAAFPAMGQTVPLPKGKDAPRVTRKPVTPADAKDAREDAKDRAKDAKDRVKDKRDDAKDQRDDKERVKVKPKDDAKDRDSDKDRTKDRDARDDDKDRVKDKRDDAKDRVKDTRDDAKDRVKDAKADAKDKASDSKQSRKFDPEKVKVDDLGIALKEADKGIAISKIEKNSVLAEAGIQSGDRIVSIAGQNVVRQNDFIRYLFGSGGATSGRVPVIVMRNGARQTVYVQPATIIRQYETVVVADGTNPVREFGIVLDDQYHDRLFVERVIPDSAADHAGVRVDDEILAVNDHKVDNFKELARMLEKHDGERIDLEVKRNRQAKVLEARVLR